MVGGQVTCWSGCSHPRGWCGPRAPRVAAASSRCPRVPGTPTGGRGPRRAEAVALRRPWRPSACRLMTCVGSDRHLLLGWGCWCPLPPLSRALCPLPSPLSSFVLVLHHRKQTGLCWVLKVSVSPVERCHPPPHHSRAHGLFPWSRVIEVPTTVHLPAGPPSPPFCPGEGPARPPQSSPAWEWESLGG